MKTLKAINIDGRIEESDFQTNEEALSWQDHLISIGYLENEWSFQVIDKVLPIEDISPRQIRTALLSLGVSESSVDTAILNLPSPQKEQAQIAWKYSLSFKRSEQAVSIIGNLLNLTSEQLDQIWTTARDL